MSTSSWSLRRFWSFEFCLSFFWYWFHIFTVVQDISSLSIINLCDQFLLLLLQFLHSVKIDSVFIGASYERTFPHLARDVSWYFLKWYIAISQRSLKLSGIHWHSLISTERTRDKSGNTLVNRSRQNQQDVVLDYKKKYQLEILYHAKSWLPSPLVILLSSSLGVMYCGLEETRLFWDWFNCDRTSRFFILHDCSQETCNWISSVLISVNLILTYLLLRSNNQANFPITSSMSSIMSLTFVRYLFSSQFFFRIHRFLS